MAEIIKIGDIAINLTRKDVKNVHLSVHPPDGRVTLVAPTATRFEVARAFAISKLAWIRSQRKKIESQAREPPRQYITRETHYLWGRRYLLKVVEAGQKPTISLDHRTIRLIVRPGTPLEKRAEIIHEWHKALLHAAVPNIISRWELRLGVSVSRYFLQRMKTKWGSCNAAARSIRINTELVKKPRDLLEYVIVHEMAHIIEPRHSERFFNILERHYPSWSTARTELNELPLSAERWQEPSSPR